MSGSEFMDVRIMPHVIDDAGCLIWQRGCCNGHPAMRYKGKTMLVRRVLWLLAHGSLPAGNILRTTCDNRLCVEPEHTEAMTMKALTKELGALGVMSGLARSAKIAKTKQAAMGKITPEQVAMIRGTSESTKSIARRLNLAQASVSKVRLHKSYRQYTSPWAGL